MSSKVPSDRSGPPSDPRSGFQAQIKGASLGDLVQMECLAGSYRVVRVTSGGSAGFLYFRGGAVVHAVARSLVGEAAALDMLSWNEGSFEAIEREWPAKDTISCTWQSLLLRAAQLRDERQAQSVVALRADVRPSRSKPPPLLVPETVEFQATPVDIAGHVLRSEDFEVVLRLDADGGIVLNQGGSQDFGDIVAYACRLTELIGNQLGADRFVAMECNFRNGRCFLVLEPSGQVVALRPHATTDCAAIRALLGL
ncbi:MAG: DUF4388 domain-containing protein [Polyangiaceae bacterium]|jgi:hypothetical protein